ncbi:MAG TPA: sterol desaturase family protein [Balneolaceae bacterium]|nr:sterol desaturase family protein [Balneolaceae bacterium]
MQELLNALEQTQVIIAFIGLIALTLYESVHPFFDFFEGSLKDRGSHFLRNMSLGLLNAFMNAFLFVGLWLWAATWANDHSFGLLNWLMVFAPSIPEWVRVVLALVLFDLWMYIWHRMNHEIPLLWRFHRVHHSDPHMDVSTATRFHTGEILLSSVLRIGVILILGMELWELFIYEILVVIVVQLHHANIDLPGKLDHYLRLVIVTPHMHKVHHSRWQPETDSNYSTIFSWWDRFLGTFRLHNPLSSIQLGLDEFDTDEDQSVKGMFRTPFINRDKKKEGD